MTNFAEPIVTNIVSEELKEKFHKSYSIACFVGAGVSASSGIKPFRGSHQMEYFEGFPPAYLCSREGLEKFPELCWRFYRFLSDITINSEPSINHHILTSWQIYAQKKRVVQFYMITSNFDGLIQKAGGTAHELHGNLKQVVCLSCNQLFSVSEINKIRCSCGGILKPDITLLNDYVKEEAYKEATTAVRGCEIFIVIGCSGVLHHVQNLTKHVKDRKSATLIEVNPRGSYLSRYMDYCLRGEAEEILPQFEYCIK